MESRRRRWPGTFIGLWFEEAQDVLLAEVLILQLKKNGKELGPKYFDQAEGEVQSVRPEGVGTMDQERRGQAPQQARRWTLGRSSRHH